MQAEDINTNIKIMKKELKKNLDFVNLQISKSSKIENLVKLEKEFDKFTKIDHWIISTESKFKTDIVPKIKSINLNLSIESPLKNKSYDKNILKNQEDKLCNYFLFFGNQNKFLFYQPKIQFYLNTKIEIDYNNKNMLFEEGMTLDLIFYNTFILIGGKTNKSIIKYSLQDNSFKQLKDLPEHKLYHKSLVHKNNIYILGGINPTSQKHSSSFYVYNIQENTINQLTDLNIKRSHFSFCISSNKK